MAYLHCVIHNELRWCIAEVCHTGICRTIECIQWSPSPIIEPMYERDCRRGCEPRVPTCRSKLQGEWQRKQSLLQLACELNYHVELVYDPRPLFGIQNQLLETRAQSKHPWPPKVQCQLSAIEAWKTHSVSQCSQSPPHKRRVGIRSMHPSLHPRQQPSPHRSSQRQ